MVGRNGNREQEKAFWGNQNHIEGSKQLVRDRLFRPLTFIEASYRAFDVAQKLVEQTIGVPICVPNCGKCCQVTTVIASDVEVKFALSALLGVNKLQQTISVCEGWLLDRNPHCTIYGMKPPLDDSQKEKLMVEVDWLERASSCPFLTDDKRCLVHEGRPTVCRAYGVTRMPGPICPRPLGLGEEADSRAHIGVNTIQGQELRSMVKRSVVEAAKVGWSQIMFFPTALFMQTEPAKFNAYIADNRIASAKLVVLKVDPENPPGILFQDQLNRVWKEGLGVAGLPG